MMPMRELGRTGLQVSRLGLGLAALGRPGYINLGHAADIGDDRSVKTMAAHCRDMLDAAWEAGIRYFDAARSYGRAEQFLTVWLDRRGLRPVTGSKWGYRYTADWQVDAAVHEVKDHGLAHLESQWHSSWRLLGQRLDIYQIHSATLETGVLDDAAVLGRLRELKENGIAIGLTLSGPDQARVLARALQTRVDGKRVFDAVQATWNLLEPSVGPALADAHAAGMGVIVKEGVANGRLTHRNDEPALAALRRAAADAGVGSDALALAAVLAQPWADVVLSGAATQPQLHANLQALDLEVDAVDWRQLAEPPGDYWARRAGLAWN